MKVNFSKLIATFFNLGNLPFSASIVCLPAIAWYLISPPSLLVLIIVILISIVASHLYSQQIHIDDPKQIIVDEFVGQLVALYFLSPTIINIFLSFLLFRLFDIKKFLYINSSQKLPGGLGIVADDVLAGLTANIIIRLVSNFT